MRVFGEHRPHPVEPARSECRGPAPRALLGQGGPAQRLALLAASDVKSGEQRSCVGPPPLVAHGVDRGGQLHDGVVEFAESGIETIQRALRVLRALGRGTGLRGALCIAEPGWQGRAARGAIERGFVVVLG